MAKCECCKQELDERWHIKAEPEFDNDVLCISCWSECGTLLNNPGRFKYITTHIDYVRKVLARRSE